MNGKTASSSTRLYLGLQKNHGGKCEAQTNKTDDISVDGSSGKKHTVAVTCKDGHETQAVHVFFHSPDKSYRGFIWIYPNAGQGEFDEAVPSTIINGWRWKQ